MDEINPEDMPLEIELIGGGGLWWQYPGTPELIGEVTKTVNLAADTSWNNITPSTSSQTILAAQSTTADRFNYQFDMINNDYVVVCESFVDVRFKSTPPQQRFAGFSAVSVSNFLRGANGRIDTTNGCFSASKSFARIAYTDANGNVCANGQTAYGITSNFSVPSIPTASVNASYITIGRAAVTVRGNTTYAPVASLQAIDAAATNIYYRWRIYRMDKSTPNAIGVRAEHMAINHTFMED